MDYLAFGRREAARRCRSACPAPEAMVGFGRRAGRPPAEPARGHTGGTMPVTLQEARRIIEAGLTQARELQQRVAIAVVDEAGNTISLDKMDGAPLYRERFATGKAFA